MGKLEKLGRSLMKKLSGRKRSRSRPRASTDMTSSSDDELMMKSTTSSRRPTTCEELHQESPVSRLYILACMELVKNNVRIPTPQEHRKLRELLKKGKPKIHDDDRLSGYGTDDTALSSLPHLETSIQSEYESSFGYHSTSELSPREREELVQEMKKFATSTLKLAPRHKTSFKSTPGLAQTLELPEPEQKLEKRAMTIDQLDRVEDPIHKFLKNNIYKTKLVTTVFEAANGGFEDLYDDVTHELERWFDKKNMIAVACELHFSVPEKKRNRALECRLKEKLLTSLRENNRRLLYLKGMGKGKGPVKLAEAKTEERISKHIESDSIRGVYQRGYTRLLPYLHAETPEWHSPYWKFKQNVPTIPKPEQFLFGQSQETLSTTTLISLNIIGLSIFGNTRRSCNNMLC